MKKPPPPVIQGGGSQGGQSFFIRWRGKQDGPFSLALIEGKLARGEIGLLHEIQAKGQWVTLKEYLGKIEAGKREEERAREEEERRRREEEERRAQEAQMRAAAGPSTASVPVEAYRRERPVPSRSMTRRFVTAGVITAGACVGLVMIGFALKMARDMGAKSGPDTRARTKAVWRDIQGVEAQCVSPQPASMSEYFRRKATLLAGIDTDDADPELREFLGRSLEIVKSYRALYEDMEEEMRKSQQGADSLSKFVELIGALAGALSKNPRGTAENMQGGQVVGKFYGDAASWMINTISDASVKSKYKTRLDEAQEAYTQLMRRKAQLQKSLGDRYNIQLLDAF